MGSPASKLLQVKQQMEASGQVDPKAAAESVDDTPLDDQSLQEYMTQVGTLVGRNDSVRGGQTRGLSEESKYTVWMLGKGYGPGGERYWPGLQGTGVPKSGEVGVKCLLACSVCLHQAL